MVVFRLSQQEYHSLREACDRRGARNLSDFTRSELLDYLSSGASPGTVQLRIAAVEQEIASMRSAINQLTNTLKGITHVYASVKA